MILILDIVEEILSELVINKVLKPSKRTDDIFEQIQTLREDLEDEAGRDDDYAGE